MEYREANSDEHEIICKQIRSKSILYVCVMSPIIPVLILAAFLSVRMMLRDRYDQTVLMVSALSVILLFTAVAVGIIDLMAGFIKRINCINKHKYMVADCSVAGRDQRISPKHIHSYITVGLPDGNTIKVEVTAKVYYLAETGKPSLLLRYDEPEGKKKKLPFEVAVL